MRPLFPTRIGLRLAEAAQVDMALRQGARTAGALCDQTPNVLPGVGYQIEDDTAQPVRVRAFHGTDADADIGTAAARYTIPDPAPSEPHADTPSASPSETDDAPADPASGF